MEDGYRAYTEKFEREFLFPAAAKSYASLGREKPLAPCHIRTCFQRDRDRIVHCNSFRRLKHKTQMFLSPDGDHFRTRLTHTMEVSQIARTIARALRLNEDLTEAIALGHDLGHTPFGHSGERALGKLLAPTGGTFAHNLQSGRVVRYLERDGVGLNLTREVIDGIEHHSGPVAPMTLEGRVVHLSDRIAYINHDIQDAIGAGLLTDAALPQRELDRLGHTHGERIDTLIRDCVDASFGRDDVAMSPEIGRSMEALRDFMFERVYSVTSDAQMDARVYHVVSSLYGYFMAHLDLLPHEYGLQRAQFSDSVAVVDYVAGMTDRYAIGLFEKLFVPSPGN